MMLGEPSESADYWKKAGDEALAHGIKGVIMMVNMSHTPPRTSPKSRKTGQGRLVEQMVDDEKGAHWDAIGDKIEVATNPNPGKSPVAYVHPSKYVDYKLNPDLPTAERCISMLSDAGFDVSGNPTFDWIHDTYLVLIRMFPNGCPPTVLVSMNARFDPHFHVQIGAVLRPLRKEGYLLVGSGGAVHNLYRNLWAPMLQYSDNFAQERPPEPWALEFRQAVEDVFTRNSGPALRRAVTRLMKHPQYREAHATDDHFMAAMFVAGAAGDCEDEGVYGELKAETWELTNMCNSQFTIGGWPRTLATASAMAAAK